MTEGLESRRLALDLLAGVLGRHRFLDSLFHQDAGLRTLSPADRGFVRLLTAETLRRLGQIDDLIARCLERPLPPKAAAVQDALRLGVCQLLFLDTAPHAAVATSVDLLKGTPHAGYAKLVNAVLRRLDREGRPWRDAQDGPRLDTPDRLWRSWSTAYGESVARRIAEANLRPAPLDLSVIGDARQWADRLGATMLPTGGLRLSQSSDVTALAGFAEGAWWVQDTAAGLPARLLGAKDGERVLDLCAAPGGKTLQLAAAGAKVTAVDISANRLESLSENLERTHLTAEIVAGDVLKWRPQQPFPKVLLDAPCSATGTLRRHPDLPHIKTAVELGKLAAAQDRLLDAAAEMVVPGGILVYSVCSLEPEEGIERIEQFLGRRPGFRRVPIAAAEVGGIQDSITSAGDLRTFPFHLAEHGGMDAFFAARLTRMPG